MLVYSIVSNRIYLPAAIAPLGVGGVVVALAVVRGRAAPNLSETNKENE